MRRFSDLDEVRSSVGEHLGHSDWHQVTQKQIDLFAEATGDHQWIHVDAARAATKSPFGTTIARGYLTLSLALMLVAEIVAARPADPSDPETYRAGDACSRWFSRRRLIQPVHGRSACLSHRSLTRAWGPQTSGPASVSRRT